MSDSGRANFESRVYSLELLYHDSTGGVGGVIDIKYVWGHD